MGLVQGNVDQAIKWDPRSADAIFQDYVRKTRQAIFEGAQLVIWPESSTPFMFEEDPVGAEQLRTLVRQARVNLLFGSDQIERSAPRKYYNSAFLLRPDGSVGGVYRKIRLVPFGEYVPFQRLLFFAAPLTEQVGTFTAGERAEVLPVNGHPVSVAICYEVIYPSLVRRFVTAGSELLTTITNDAWFGDTSAPAQHFEQAAMKPHEQVMSFAVRHSLSIVLATTGVLWAIVYARSDVNGKAGQVIGNIVSEWTQILGLVLITKYARETGSKE